LTHSTDIGLLRSEVDGANAWSAVTGGVEVDNLAALFLGRLLCNSPLQYLNSDLSVAHRTLLRLDLLGAFEPLHHALVVEDVPTGGDFAHFSTISKLVHADYALCLTEFINFFVALFKLEYRYEPLVVLELPIMCHFLFLLALLSHYLALLLAAYVV